MRLHPLRVTTILCCAGFDATLQDLLRDARSVGPQAAVSRWAGALDATFLPTLSTQLDAAADCGEEARCAELMGLMEAVEQACAAERALGGEQLGYCGPTAKLVQRTRTLRAPAKITQRLPNCLHFLEGEI